MTTPHQPDLRALAADAAGDVRVDMHADLSDLDLDEQAEYFDQADAVLAAVLPTHRDMVLTEAVGREAASPTADCGHDLEAFERQAAELTKLRVQVQAGACPHTEVIGELHLKWLAEVADLKQRILDIDAHATPYGDIPDEPGWVGTYLVTAGALHRALGRVGHSAPKCQAEAERDRLADTLQRVRELFRRTLDGADREQKTAHRPASEEIHTEEPVTRLSAHTSQGDRS